MNRVKHFLQKQGVQSAAASILAILIGFAFGFLILLVSNPSSALEGLGIILKGGFSGGAMGAGQVLYFATPIIMTGLSVGFAFKTGLFNIGASGQFIVGAFVAVYIGVKWTFLPAPFHWIVAILMAGLAGGLWGLIPGLFKAFLNVNEVISSIMMNYIGMYAVNALVRSTIYNPLKAQSVDVAQSAVLPKAGLDKIFYNQVGNSTRVSSVSCGIFIAIGFAIVIYIILNRTTFGYELKAVSYTHLYWT